MQVLHHSHKKAPPPYSAAAAQGCKLAGCHRAQAPRARPQHQKSAQIDMRSMAMRVQATGTQQQWDHSLCSLRRTAPPHALGASWCCLAARRQKCAR